MSTNPPPASMETGPVNEPDSSARRMLLRATGFMGLATAVATPSSGATAMSRSVQEKLADYWVTPQDYGAKGDGTSDDAAAFEAMFSAGRPVYIPYTAGGYYVSKSIRISSDVVCNGFIVPAAAIGRASDDFSKFAVIIAASDYNTKRSIAGLRVQGSVELRAAGVCGIRCDAPNTRLERCQAFRLDRGIVVRNYSVLVEQCAAWQCNTNLSAYARSTKEEINALTIVGGNYDSAVDFGIRIGDTSWSDALPASQNHGVMISILGGVNVDGSCMHIDAVAGVFVRTFYVESPKNSDCGIRLGGSGDGNLRNVDIGNSFFKNARYAIKCESAVNGLEVGRNFYTQIRSSALYLKSDLYHFSYTAGDATASFNQGVEVHTAFRSLPLENITWRNFSMEHHGLRHGVQAVIADPGSWYPGGELKTPGPSLRSCNTGSSGRFYTTPKTRVAGTINANVFAFANPADCFAFNGGDRILCQPQGATYVRSVDYAAGTMVVGGGNMAGGAVTVSQIPVTWYSTTVTYSGAPPGTGNWARGDYCRNGNPVVGAPKGWFCTEGGSPGTWRSDGVL